MIETNEFTIPKFVNNETSKSDNEEPIIFSEEEWNELPKSSADGDLGCEEENFEDDKVCSESKEEKVEDKKVSPAQLQSVAQWAKGLRREEAIVVLDNIPLDLIFAKIGKELEKNKRFTEAITNAMDIIK